MKTFIVGIIGCGVIAKKFAEAASGMEGVEIAFVTDAFLDSARSFAAEYPVGRVLESVDELLRQDLDLVYIATPNTAHFELAEKALNCGKNVLCEKPMTVNVKETEALVQLARKKGLFLCEGLWTKTLPFYQEVKRIIKEGIIGDVRVITADYFFRAPWNPGSRLLNPDLGGGTILDIGIYELVLVDMILGTEPVSVSSTCYKGETGVDEITSITLKYKDGAIASLISSIRTPAPQKAVILGIKGRIEIEEFGRAQKGVLYIYGEERDTSGSSSGRAGVRSSVPEGGEIIPLHYPHEINGFEFEIQAIREAIFAGNKECDLITLQDSINIHRIIEEARNQWD